MKRDRNCKCGKANAFSGSSSSNQNACSTKSVCFISWVAMKVLEIECCSEPAHQARYLPIVTLANFSRNPPSDFACTSIGMLLSQTTISFNNNAIVRQRACHDCYVERKSFGQIVTRDCHLVLQPVGSVCLLCFFDPFCQLQCNKNLAVSFSMRFVNSCATTIWPSNKSQNGAWRC